jgi:thiamine biosynthesis lipoprotein
VIPSLVLLLFGAQAADDRTREVRVLMNTVAEIEVSGLSEPEEAIAEAFDAIQRAESALSIWDDESEISRLNERRQAVLSEEAFLAVQQSIETARSSGGAFDPTLVARGYEKVRLDPDVRAVRLEGNLRLDLGAIAKGHAADRALESLRRAGASSGLVDLGTSSVALFGDEDVGFEIRNPKGGPSPASFRLRRGALGSSSEDQQGSHIVDPRKGEAPSLLLAATVVAETAAEADALSTAVFVLGETAGLALLKARGAEGVVLLEENERLLLASTPGFAGRYALEVAEGVVSR